MATQASDTTTTLEHIDFGDASSLIRFSRAECANIAKDTLNKLNIGLYYLNGGSQVNLKDDITFCNKNSVLYTEDDLQNIEQLNSTVNEIDSSSSITTSTTTTTWNMKIEVRCCTTLQAARSLVADVGEERVGVLNFASAKNPGGGFINGAQAQEESIARSSSLYLALTQAKFLNGFYNYNRNGEKGFYSHRMIYSPRVTIFKDDNGELLSSPYHVGILTAPAPNAGAIKDSKATQNTMMERVKRLLYVFKENKHDHLVLGAFGCGVFQNNPLDVAIIFREHLESEEYRNYFKRIIFAVLNAEMCQIFEQVFTTPDLTTIQRRVTTISQNDRGNKHNSYNNRNKQNKKKR